ncbi:MAG: RHS repeat-associated core domain-containing protein, partial [Muribaculaceae bacterium]|nr:RHS repeat-associated core domain-containing protein [Muribaculaceae bacterium]
SYSDGSSTQNVYSASGEKLKTTHTTAVNGKVTGQTTTEYRGNVIYRDGKVDTVLFPGGYATINGTAVTFHYYTQDYLGNNRAVINGSTGAIEQTVAYYPYGAVIADLGANPTKQPYKFGGKELITANGLNEYDFGAHNYYPAVPSFTKPDQMAEKYPWLSPYLYCANNPVNLVNLRCQKDRLLNK